MASEALRIANQNSGKTLFEWNLVSVDGNDVCASNGMSLKVDYGLVEMPESDYYFLFEGNLPTQNNSPKLLKKLSGVYRAGATVVGVDTGAFALMQAGLVDDTVVVHWEAAATFHERFAKIPNTDRVFHSQDRIISCAGGVATLDLMLELIKKHYGETLSIEVANALVHKPREGWQSQRVDYTTANNERSLLDRLLELMQRNLDFPLSANEIAQNLSVSQSTLERHCKLHFGYTPMQLYLGVRLQAARNFLFYEDYSIKEVALAHGFSSPAVFSRVFKNYFSQTPSKFRASLRAKQSRNRLPEIRRLYQA